MGRPLHKKYFGNRNIGSASTSTDNRIGGSSVASVVLNALGAYTTRPTFTFTAPTIPGGVTATGTISSEVESVTAVGGTQVGYTVGQLITVDGTDAVLRVATLSAGDDAATFDFTGGSRGNFTTLTSGAQATTSNGTGTGLTVTLSFRAKAVVITEPGSGYVTAPTSTPTQSVTFTSVALTADTGAPGTATNQENAIIIRAKTTTGGTVQIGDVIKQTNTRSYKVKTADGIAVCKLVSSDTPAFGEAYIVATASGGTYYVTKLTARKATLVTKTGDAVLNGKAVKWTFGASSATVVQLENA
jgi:hypothetical protein